MKRIGDVARGEIPPRSAGPLSVRWGIVLVLAGFALVGGLVLCVRYPYDRENVADHDEYEIEITAYRDTQD
ncbi:hypothetical protein [Microtetraspora fusca]|uniref:Uncharacterized protein n=1 Tax=Microtetraspora fusca TaxID=1997 RepID=A0ABW6VJQ3_MICFU|nr:hypothetical protein [Microtetraspora fusca]